MLVKDKVVQSAWLQCCDDIAHCCDSFSAYAQTGGIEQANDAVEYLVLN